MLIRKDEVSLETTATIMISASQASRGAALSVSSGSVVFTLRTAPVASASSSFFITASVAADLASVKTLQGFGNISDLRQQAPGLVHLREGQAVAIALYSASPGSIYLALINLETGAIIWALSNPNEARHPEALCLEEGLGQQLVLAAPFGPDNYKLMVSFFTSSNGSHEFSLLLDAAAAYAELPFSLVIKSNSLMLHGTTENPAFVNSGHSHGNFVWRFG